MNDLKQRRIDLHLSIEALSRLLKHKGKPVGKMTIFRLENGYYKTHNLTKTKQKTLEEFYGDLNGHIQ